MEKKEAKKGAVTRSTILARALSLASSAGLNSLTIGTLADSVGMSKSGLFAHFKSKEELQLQVLKEASARFVENVVQPAFESPRGEPRIRALFDRWLTWSQSLPSSCVFRAAAAQMDDNDEGPLRDFLTKTQNDLVATISRAARIAIEERHFRGDLDVDQWAYEAYGIVVAYFQIGRLLRDPAAERHARRAFESLLERAR